MATVPGTAPPCTPPPSRTVTTTPAATPRPFYPHPSKGYHARAGRGHNRPEGTGLDCGDCVLLCAGPGAVQPVPAGDYWHRAAPGSGRARGRGTGRLHNIFFPGSGPGLTSKTSVIFSTTAPFGFRLGRNSFIHATSCRKIPPLVWMATVPLIW